MVGGRGLRVTNGGAMARRTRTTSSSPSREGAALTGQLQAAGEAEQVYIPSCLPGEGRRAARLLLMSRAEP